VTIPNYTYCRGYNSEYHLWVILRWCTLGKAALLLIASCKEQCSAIRFRWAKELSTNVIHSEMRPVYGDKCFTRRAIHAWYESLLMVMKVFTRKNLIAVLFRRLMQGSQQSILSGGLTGVWWDKCLNEFGWYVENWKMKC